MTGKILFVGGTGVVGEQMVRHFRDRHPDIPLLIGGQNIDKAAALARDVGLAEAVQVDTAQPRLGLGRDADVGAVVMVVQDAGLQGLRYALDLGHPYLSIGNWLVEVGGEMAHVIRRPSASPVVLSSHWHAGPTVFLALASMTGLDAVHSIHVSAIVDDLDPTGPAALEDMDLGGAGALAFREGRRVWLTGADATRDITAIDGRTLSAAAFAPYDIVSLQAASGAADIRFDLASGISSSRLRGGTVGTEVILDIAGERDGRKIMRRSTLEFTRGQASLTGLSATLSLSATLGLAGRPAFPAGLYFPEQLMEPDGFLGALEQAGATITIDQT
ncbi:hypothetical protein [Paracoccus liaowanqingii]|nr:hypothetical protein [Paracoccus liaowanqingii]